MRGHGQGSRESRDRELGFEMSVDVCLLSGDLFDLYALFVSRSFPMYETLAHLGLGDGHVSDRSFQLSGDFWCGYLSCQSFRESFSNKSGI